jgi:hypothetical protein
MPPDYLELSRLLHKDEPSTLVGKKATHAVGNSETDHKIESLYSPLKDNKEILDCLLTV